MDNNRGWVGVLALIVLVFIIILVVTGYLITTSNFRIKLPELSLNFSLPNNSKSLTEPEVKNLTIPFSLPKILIPTLVPTTLPLPTIPSIRPINTSPIVTFPPFDLNQETCEYFEIKSGELKSNKCYTNSDFLEIRNLYADYDFETSTLDFTEDRIDLVCDGSSFFKDSCEDAKNDLDKQKREIEKLKNEIKKIIRRGK